MSDQQITSYIQRVQRLQEEKRTIEDDIKEVYAEARSNGYDVKVLRAVVKHLGKDADEVAEFDAIFDLYLQSFKNGLAGAGAGRATHAHEQRNTSPDLSPAAQNEGAAGASPGKVASDSAGGADIVPAQGAKFVTQAGAGESVPATADPAPAADAKPFARLLRHQDCRPHCKKPDACGSATLDHCFTCKQALAASEREAA